MNKLGPLHIIKQTNKVNTASVIFLHGSGDTGEGFLQWIKFLVEDFSLPHVKFLFPTAPNRPYTYLNGQLSTVWFDRYAITPEVPEDNQGILDIKDKITTLVNKEVEAGIPLNRIIIGGFSMGGALALHLGYRFLPGLAGVFALSSFLNKDSKVYKNIESVNTPLFMCHGEMDDLVQFQWGKTTFENLQQLGVKGSFIPLKNTLHELKEREILDLLEWIKKTVP